MSSQNPKHGQWLEKYVHSSFCFKVSWFDLSESLLETRQFRQHCVLREGPGAQGKCQEHCICRPFEDIAQNYLTWLTKGAEDWSECPSPSLHYFFPDQHIFKAKQLAIDGIQRLVGGVRDHDGLSGLIPRFLFTNQWCVNRDQSWLNGASLPSISSQSSRPFLPTQLSKI